MLAPFNPQHDLRLRGHSLCKGRKLMEIAAKMENIGEDQTVLIGAFLGS
jgi:hypothetical protein